MQPILSSRVSRAALLGCFLGLFQGAIAAQEALQPPASVHYQVHYAPEGRERAWKVVIDATGLAAPASSVRVELENWGEWTETADEYLLDLQSTPPLRAVTDSKNQWEVEQPKGWDGQLHVEYQLALLRVDAPLREQCGLRPYWTDSYCLGYSANSLMQVHCDKLRYPPVRALSLHLPAGWIGLTGVGMPETPGVLLRIPAEHENFVLSFGQPRAQVQCSANPTMIDVIQWAGEKEVATEVCRFARIFLETCTKRIGLPPRGSVRLAVTEPGAGGTRTDGAIALGCPEPREGGFAPYTAHFIGHELFHEWLGGIARPEGEHLAWITEGFSEYFSLYFLAQAGLVPREWFAERMLDYIVATNSNPEYGKHAFADPGVNWRDPALEPLAYHGGALLACALDMELRRQGKVGVILFFRALTGPVNSRFGLDRLRNWCSQEGLGTFYEKHILAPTRFDTIADLASIGCYVHLSEGVISEIQYDKAVFADFFKSR